MCEPFTIAMAAVAAVGTVASASAQRSAGKAQARAYGLQAQNLITESEYNAETVENVSDYNAQIADNNSDALEAAADDAIQRGADDAAVQRQTFRQANSRGRAIMGSSGTVVDSGTNLKLLTDNAGMGEMNALTVMNNAEREAYQYRSDAVNERNRATGIRYTGDLQAGGIRLSGQTGSQNAQYAGSVANYNSGLEASATLINGFSSIASMSKPLFV